MNTGYKMTMAFIALLMIVGISASATRASRSALAHEADSANIKQQAAADSQKINEGSVVDEVIWVVGDEAILKSDVEVTRLRLKVLNILVTQTVLFLSRLPFRNCFSIRQLSIVSKYLSQKS